VVKKTGIGRALVLVIFGAAFCGLVSLTLGAEVEFSRELILRGDGVYDERFRIEAAEPMAFLTAYKPYIEEAIGFYALAVEDPILLLVQSQSYVYNRLAQLHYELAKVLILEGASVQEIKGTLVAGKEYGFKSLGLHAGFDRERFANTIDQVTDVAALVWTANCWGTWLGYNPIEGLMNLSKIRLMYEQAIRIDGSFWNGSADVSLGAILATTPSVMGGDLDEAKAHFERALKIDPNYLPASVVYAESYGFTHSFGSRNGLRDRGLIEDRLAFVRDASVGQERPFWNWEAKAEAVLLWSEIERFSQ
jgi:tetratricopeptide (TPR) repeat protein